MGRILRRLGFPEIPPPTGPAPANTTDFF
jgi:hypothetical protein